MVVQLPRTTTEGQRSQGGASRSLGGRDDSRSLSSSKRRWIPPSSLRRDALSQDNQNEVIFRKIRGLLNKLTPETFDKLSNELLNVGLNARVVLEELILLIFQKALDEPKYCSMYAQLCKRLSEDAPNFDPPNTACTFNRLLLKQCQDEFERRRNNKAAWHRAEDEELTPEEEEQRQAARRKMVGNLRFIGELGKLQIIQKSILYRCIEELLEKTRGPNSDLAEDLECLCQIMRTSGRILDIPEAQNLMEQYFARIRRLSQRPELNLRIRFMLQDILDLRKADWQPRKIAQQDGPRTITEVREQAARDLGIYIPPPSATAHSYSGMMSPLSTTMPTFFPQTGMTRTGMEDVFGMPMGGAASLGTGPGVISSQPDKFAPFGDEPNGFGVPMGMGPGHGRGGDGMPYPGGRNNRHHMQGGMQSNYLPNNTYYQNKHFTNNYNRHMNNNPHHQGGGPPSGGGGGGGGGRGGYDSGSKDLPPRFKKMFVSNQAGGGGMGLPGGGVGGPGSGGSSIMGGGGGGAGGGGGVGGASGGGGGDRNDHHHHGELSLRPSSAHSMSLKPKTPGLLPQSALSSSSSNDTKPELHRPPLGVHYPNVQPPNPKPPSMAPILHKDPPLVIKQIPAEKTNKSKKEKGPTREEYMRRVRALMDKLSSETSAKAAAASEKTAAEGSVSSNGTSSDEAPYCSKVAEACQAYKDIKLPDRLTADAAHALFSTILKLDEAGREVGSRLLVQLGTENLITHDKLWDGLKQVLSEVEAGISDCPRGKGQLAEVLAQLVLLSTFTLSELADPMQAGEHFPLYLLILQHLHKLAGKARLTELFNESKVNLLNLVPESERTKEQLSDLLEDRELSFLFPLLRIQSQLSAALAKEPSAHAFFKYIRETLDAKHHTAPEFVNALVTVLLKYITHGSTMAPWLDHTAIPDKSVSEMEKEGLALFKPVLQAFLHAHHDLQVIAIYALQVYTYTNNFPKGMLLRWFAYLYDLEIVEEEAFLAWKEDVNDNYPGKGKALFQVNQWLTWLQETEEDDDDDDDDEEEEG